jgi:general nucleoside transport system permease protein
MPDRVRPMGDSLTLAVTSTSITRPVSLWLGLPCLLALIALGAEGRRRHRAVTALAIPYPRSEA